MPRSVELRREQPRHELRGHERQRSARNVVRAIRVVPGSTLTRADSARSTFQARAARELQVGELEQEIVRVARSACRPRVT